MRRKQARRRGAGGAAEWLHVLMLSRLGRNEGGRETWLYEFVPRLVRALPAVRVSVLGIRSDGDPPVDGDLEACAGDVRDRFSILRLRVRKTRWPLAIGMMRELWRHTRASSFDAPDIVLGMGIFELPMVLLPAYRRSVRCVWLRGIFVHEKAYRIPRWLSPMVLKTEALLLRRVDCVLANGHDIAKFYQDMGVDVHVIENGVDLERWALESTPRMHGKIHVAFIGRLTKVKGILEYLGAVGRFDAEEGEKYAFHVVGGGSEEYASRLRACGDRMKRHGVISNSSLPAFLKDIDVCVALTWADARGGGGGTSNALFEQMAAGRIIVAWDNVIFRAVLDETCAYLVPQGDVDALADAFREIASHPDEARRRAANGVERARRYDIGGRVQSCVALFEGLLERRLTST